MAGFLQNQAGCQLLPGFEAPVFLGPGERPPGHGPGLRSGGAGPLAAGEQDPAAGMVLPPELQGMAQAQLRHPAGLAPGIEAGPQDDEGGQSRRGAGE